MSAKSKHQPKTSAKNKSMVTRRAAAKRTSPSNALAPIEPEKRNPKVIFYPGSPDVSREQSAANMAHDPVFRAIAGSEVAMDRLGGEVALTESLHALQNSVSAVRSGDLSSVEATLVAQANTLDAVFNDLMRRAAYSDRWDKFEMFMRLGFKAQGQTRTTLETLAEIKNPRTVAFVRQANIANGGAQQVNNCVPSRVGDFQYEPTELSGDCHELLPDGRTSALAGATNQEVATVGKIDRPKVTRGKSKVGNERQ